MKLRSLLWLSLLGLAACEGDGDDTAATPPGPVCGYFSALSPRGGEWLQDNLTNTCLPDAYPPEPPELVIGCDRQLVVDVQLDESASNWTFRQPDACGNSPQCGYLVVELDAPAETPPVLCSPEHWPALPDESGLPDPTVTSCGESALNTVLLDLGAFRRLSGSHELRATLMNADRTPFLGFGPIYLPVALSAEDCSTPDDAG